MTKNEMWSDSTVKIGESKNAGHMLTNCKTPGKGDLV